MRTCSIPKRKAALARQDTKTAQIACALERVSAGSAIRTTAGSVSEPANPPDQDNAKHGIDVIGRDWCHVRNHNAGHST